MNSKELLEQADIRARKITELGLAISTIEELIPETELGHITINSTGIFEFLDEADADEIKLFVLDELKHVNKQKITELEKLLGIRKPATINPEFEAAVQGMIDSVKKPKGKLQEEMELLAQEVMPDPVDDKLTEILQTEAKRIEQPDKSLDKYPAKKGRHSSRPESMTVEAVTKMYVTDGADIDVIAKHFGVTDSIVKNYLFRNQIKRKSKAKQSVPAETERP